MLTVFLIEFPFNREECCIDVTCSAGMLGSCQLGLLHSSIDDLVPQVIQGPLVRAGQLTALNSKA